MANPMGAVAESLAVVRRDADGNRERMPARQRYR